MGIDVGTIIYVALAYYAAIALALGLTLMAAGTIFTKWILPRVRPHIVALQNWRRHPEVESNEPYVHQAGRA